MAVDKYIKRVYTTWANAINNLDAEHTAILSDQKNEHIYKIGGNFYFTAMSKYWDGSSWNYMDTEFNDITIYNNSTFENLPFVNVTDTPTDDSQLITKRYADNLEVSPAGTDGQIQYNDNGSFGAISSLSDYISGTEKQVSVTDNGDGVTLSTPQDINATAQMNLGKLDITGGTVITDCELNLRNTNQSINQNYIKSFSLGLDVGNPEFQNSEIEMGSAKDLTFPDVYDRAGYLKFKLYDEKVSEITPLISLYNKSLYNDSDWPHPLPFIAVTDGPAGFGGFSGFSIMKMDKEDDIYQNYDYSKTAKTLFMNGAILSTIGGEIDSSQAVPDEIESAIATKRLFAELSAVDITAGTRKPWITLVESNSTLPDNANLWGNTTITDGDNVNFGQLTFAPKGGGGHSLYSRADGLILTQLYARWTGAHIPPSSAGSVTIYSDTYDAFGVYTENNTLRNRYGINTGLITPATDTANYKAFTEKYKTDGSINEVYKEFLEGSGSRSYIGNGFFGMDSKTVTPTVGLNDFGKYFIKNDKPYFVSSTGTDEKIITENPIYINSGNVGIGTASPSALLDLNGENHRLVVTDAGDSDNQRVELGHSTAGGGFLELIDDSNDSNVLLRSYGNSYFTGGRVGIGTGTPMRDLHYAANVPVFRLSDMNASTVTEIVSFIEYYQGNDTTRTGLIGYVDDSNGHLEMRNSVTGGDINFLTEDSIKMTIDDSGNVGIGTSSPSANADLTLEGGTLCIKETTTPAADTNYGKVYTKNDNKLYFQDGAGTEHEIAFV